MQLLCVQEEVVLDKATKGLKTKLPDDYIVEDPHKLVEGQQ
jgi:hypothetical protein